MDTFVPQCPPLNVAQITEVDTELTRLATFNSRTDVPVVYSPLILNTVLVMFYLQQRFYNLFIPMDDSETGGYQLTLSGDSAAENPDRDLPINDRVNGLVNEFMLHSGKDKIAVSLMFIDPTNAANNHANMILFLKVSGVWRAYHYEPHGLQLAQHFHRWFATGQDCIRAILLRLGIRTENIHTHNQTRIHQTEIDRIQNQLTEGGYCQMIAALQAYLFLLLGIVNRDIESERTPLGTKIPIFKEGTCSLQVPLHSVFEPSHQLAIIRGFVIFISMEINRLLFSKNINFSITRISEIKQYYATEQSRTGINRPLYLYYLDAALKFITDEVHRGTIRLEQCARDCGVIEPIEIGVEDFSQLNAQMSTLLGLLNGAVVLTKAAKMQIYNNFQTAAREAAGKRKSETKGAPEEKRKKAGGTRKYKRRKSKRTRKHKKRKYKRRKSKKTKK
jgi:hypothetical protein